MWPTLLLVLYVQMVTAKKLVYYADFEHPNVTYFNSKYLEYAKLTAQRYSRRDPIHYINVHAKLLIDFGNDITMTYNAYEFLSNEYRPGMFVMTFQICDFFSEPKYAVFKPIYIKHINGSLCPFPKGEYKFLNLSIPPALNLPLLSTFPYQKGRLFFSFVRGGERVADGYLDAAIKQKFI